MSRDKSCRETNFVSHREGNFERGKRMTSLVGERQFGRHFRRQFGRGYLRVKNCLETVERQFLPQERERHQDVSQGPLGFLGESRHQFVAERIWDEFLFLIFVFCGYNHCVVPWVVTVLRHQRLGIEDSTVFRDAT